ncbi:MAG: T9SS type A sorting domain-containing protein [Crocinitomicaceae bacterium]
MRKYVQFSFWVVLILLNTSRAQPLFQWKQNWGGVSNEQSRSLDLFTNDEILITGIFQGTLDFDQGNGIAEVTTSASGSNYASFMLKLDQSGNYQWVKSILPTNSANSVDIRDAYIDQNDDIYLVGAMKGDVVFDTLSNDTIFSAGSSTNAFVAKYDAQGQFLWGHSFGSSQNQYASGIDVDMSGNVYVCGYFNNAMDLSQAGGGQFSSNGGLDGYILKLDQDGDFQWFHAIGGPGEDRLETIKVNTGGTIVAGGTLSGDFDINPGAATNMTNTNEIYEAFAVKFNEMGDYQWVKIIHGGADYDVISEIGLLSDQSLVLVGSFYATVQFGPMAGQSSVSSGQSDVFALKVDQNGNYAQHLAFGGTASDDARCLNISATDKMLIGGNFYGTVDFDPSGNTATQTSSGQSDGYTVGFDANWNYLWSQAIGGTNFDGMYDVKTNYQETIFSTGIFRLSTDLDPAGGASVTSAGDYDFYLQVLGDCANKYHAYTENACNVFQLSNGMDITQSGIYLDTIQLASGCDSIVTIDLNITAIDSSVALMGNVLSSNMNGASYQWIDCGNGNVSIQGEVGQTFTASVDGSYAVMVSSNGCTSTSDCIAVNTSSIIEWNENILIYPNPASSEVKVDWSNGKTATLRIFDLNGRELLNQVFINSLTLNMDAFESGMYYFELFSGADRVIKSVVVNK